MKTMLFEKVFITGYFWLIAILVMGTALSIFVIVSRRITGVQDNRTEPFIRLPQFLTAKRRKKDAFSEKLGERVVGYMIEIAGSKDKGLLKDRIAKIRRECERLARDPLPEETKRIINNVLFWATHFDVDRHVSEMEIYRKSTQIVYDRHTRDFKLRVSGE